MKTITNVHIPSMPAPKVGAVQWFQWEFLRRNPDFRKDYERYKQLLKSANNKRRGSVFEHQLSKRWGIAIRPALVLEQPLNKQPALLPDIVFQFFTEPRMAVIPGRDSHPLVPLSGAGITHWNRKTINLRVNLDASLNEMRRQFNYWVVVWKTLRSSRVRQPKRRHRFNDWKYQLMVYDLKVSGKNLREIAQAVHGVSSRHAEDRVSKAYQAARRLIDGGYRKISL